MPKRRLRRKKGLRRRCDAYLPRSRGRLERARHEDRLEEYLGRRSHCRKWAMRGSKRCRLHGGLSTGPTTPGGMARTIAAMKEGRARWLAGLKAGGKPIPCGRKKGGRNLRADEREQLAYEKKCRRAAQKMLRQNRIDRNRRRSQEGKENRRRVQEHKWRKARMDVGGAYWTDEELEKL